MGLVSDAGMPGLSDPGFLAARMTVEHGHCLEVVPGPTAISVALALSGLPASSYTFKGFAPRKPGKRRRFLAADAHTGHTLVLFESARRLGALLVDARDVLGDRRAAVCLEMTKMFEGTFRGTLAGLAERFSGPSPQGEVTVVIAGDKPTGADTSGSARTC